MSWRLARQLQPTVLSRPLGPGSARQKSQDPLLHVGQIQPDAAPCRQEWLAEGDRKPPLVEPAMESLKIAAVAEQTRTGEQGTGARHDSAPVARVEGVDGEPAQRIAQARLVRQFEDGERAAEAG